jgi:hypothetical protein
MNTAEVMNAFCYHPPRGDQPKRYEALRNSGQELAFQILELCPDGRERSIAIRKLEEAVMWANKAIAVGEAGK